MTDNLPDIPVARPTLGEEEAQAARRAILSGWVVQGPEVAAFEQEFAQIVGAPFAVAVSSGTAALHLAMMALNIGTGDDVVTVSHSFIATANAARYVGANPVFVDVEFKTGNIDADQLARAVSRRTRAILVVHQLGIPCNLEAILPLARDFNIKVVEDAACALGSEIKVLGGGGQGLQTPGRRPPGPPLNATSVSPAWEPIGKPHGDLACFSFHPRKVITTGDGGMITGADPKLMERLARLRTHSMSMSAAERHGAGKVVFEQYLELGYNYRLTDIQGAMGREQLKRLPGMIAARRRLAARYQEALSGHPFIALPQEPPYARSNWQSFWVTLTPECPYDQHTVMQELLRRGIHIRRGVMCAHREPAYARQPLHWPLPVSEYLQDHSIILPLYPDMTEAEQERVIGALKECLRTG